MRAVTVRRKNTSEPVAKGARKRPSSTKSLRERLEEAESTLTAIHKGQIDALVVFGAAGEQTLTIDGSAHPYFELLDAMSDGAALLDPSGAILFGNQTFRDMIGVPVQSDQRAMFHRWIAPAQRRTFRALLRSATTKKVAGTFTLEARGGEARPITVALSAVSVGSGLGGVGAAERGHPRVVMAILTDLTFRIQAEATRVRLLERVISAEDDERRRIARELHDETGQSLTALSVGLRAILDMQPPAAIRSVATRLRAVAANTIDDVGRLARGLHPAVLDDKGLAAAARRYTQDYVRAFGTDLRFFAGNLDSPRLTPIAAATSYRILQESLTNVARHARATKITVELKRDALALVVLVRDNGIGFDAHPPADGTPGLGLNGMRERVTLLGGAIDIVSRPGRGTAVLARIPAARGASRSRPAQRPSAAGESTR